MEDEYELVPKQYLKDLKEENKRLKEELKNPKKEEPEEENPKVDDKIEFVNHIIEVLHEESKKERELIINNLNDIKELNKSTLDNIIDKTQSLDSRLENMVDTLKNLTGSLTELMNNYPNEDNSEEKGEVKHIIEKLDSIDISKSTEMAQERYISQINQKLAEIELFMNNLKILLGQIKPSDMKLE